MSLLLILSGSSAHPVTLSPTGIASAEAFGVPAVSTGAITISPIAIDSSEAFGAIVVTQTGILSPTGIGSGEVFGVPAVSVGALTLSPTGIASAEAFGVLTVLDGGITLSPTGIASSEAFGVLAVSTSGITISPSGIASAWAFGVPVVAQTGIVSPATGIAGTTGRRDRSILYEIAALLRATHQFDEVSTSGLPEVKGFVTTSHSLASLSILSHEEVFDGADNSTIPELHKVIFSLIIHVRDDDMDIAADELDRLGNVAANTIDGVSIVGQTYPTWTRIYKSKWQPINGPDRKANYEGQFVYNVTDWNQRDTSVMYP